MIEKSTFDFLKAVGEHDGARDWFDDHRDEYTAARENMIEFAADLVRQAPQYDPVFEQANPDPRACVARLHRDMRFTKGRKPEYKDFWYIMLKSPGAASYYVQVKPGDTFAGGGAFNPEPATLDAMRTLIRDNLGDWRRIVDAGAVKAMFPNPLVGPEPLKVAPHGYDPDDPAIEYLRMKGWCANRPLTMKTMQGAGAVDAVVETFATIEPMVTFLNKAAH